MTPHSSKLPTKSNLTKAVNFERQQRQSYLKADRLAKAVDSMIDRNCTSKEIVSFVIEQNYCEGNFHYCKSYASDRAKYKMNWRLRDRIAWLEEKDLN